ncbi:MAG: acyltransferase [Planctomycetes bacterium]|nr:acyltransferase [Planctomycetota bacterium]
MIFLHLGTLYLRRTNVEWALPLSQDPLHFLRTYCAIGVPLFYCLSGFILCLPFGKEVLLDGKAISIRRFYARRLTRLEPPYIIALTAFFLVHLFVLNESFAEAFPHYLASLFYLHSIIYGEWSTILPVAWTLEIEVQFYLVAPFFARYYFARGLRLRRALLVIAVLGFATVETLCLEALAPYHLDRTLLTKAHYFLSGALICDVFITDREFFKKRAVRWDVLFAVALLGSSAVRVLWGSAVLIDRFVFTASLMIVFLCAFKGVLANRFFTHPWIYLTGGMCYTLYLLHYPFFFFTGTFFGVAHVADIFSVNFLLQMLWNIPLLALVATPFYLLIERPCMDRLWPQKLASFLRRRAPGSKTG